MEFKVTNMLRKEYALNVAKRIFEVFTNHQFGKEVIKAAKEMHPEYKSEPGYDTTGEAIDHILEKIEDNHSQEDTWADPIYSREVRGPWVDDFTEQDEEGGSIRYYLRVMVGDLLLGK